MKIDADHRYLSLKVAMAISKTGCIRWPVLMVGILIGWASRTDSWSQKRQAPPKAVIDDAWGLQYFRRGFQNLRFSAARATRLSVGDRFVAGYQARSNLIADLLPKSESRPRHFLRIGIFEHRHGHLT